jgi:hypothetical protein
MWRISGTKETVLNQMVQKASALEDTQSSGLKCRLALGLGAEDRFRYKPIGYTR